LLYGLRITNTSKMNVRFAHRNNECLIGIRTQGWSADYESDASMSAPLSPSGIKPS